MITSPSAAVSSKYDDAFWQQHPELFTAINQCTNEPKEDETTHTEFWAKFPELRARIEKHAMPPQEATQAMSDWINRLSKAYEVRTWIAKPASFDLPFLKHLFMMHPPLNSFDIDKLFSTKCMSTMIFTLTKVLGVSKLPPVWTSKSLRHTHFPLDDAREQGWYFLCITHMAKDYIKAQLLSSR
jgi:hypothetical protein